MGNLQAGIARPPDKVKHSARDGNYE
jgi:hypothetical protein